MQKNSQITAVTYFSFFDYYVKISIILRITYIPKSSNEIFSSGTPRLSSILITALFIRGGPQK